MSTARLGDEIEIDGGYQDRAVRSRNPVQRYWHRAKFTLIDRHCPPVPGGRMLDAGCGSGHIAAHLAASGGQVLGIDSSPRAIEYATAHFGSTRCRFALGQFEDFGSPGEFDAVYCIEVIEHLYPEQAAAIVRHFHRILKPGGRLVLTTPNARSAWPLIEWMLDALRLVPRMHESQHVSAYTPRSLADLVTSAGLAIERQGTFNGLAPFVSIAGATAARVAEAIERRLAYPGHLLWLVARK